TGGAAQGAKNAVKTRRVEQAVVSRPLPKNYSSRSYESSLDGTASNAVINKIEIYGPLKGYDSTFFTNVSKGKSYRITLS
ncbi:hypothetical protein TNCV_2232321, partial [Trichonephila clavipes]